MASCNFAKGVTIWYLCTDDPGHSSSTVSSIRAREGMFCLLYCTM